MDKETPEYIKNAVRRYNKKFDRISVSFPKGTKERIKNATDKSLNVFIRDLVLDELEHFGKRESFQTDYDRTVEQEDDYDTYTIDGP